MNLVIIVITLLLAIGGAAFIIKARIPRAEKNHRRVMRQINAMVRRIEKDNPNE